MSAEVWRLGRFEGGSGEVTETDGYCIEGGGGGGGCAGVRAEDGE